MNNHWVSFEKSFATWYITLPEITRTSTDIAFEFVEGFLTIAEREQLLLLHDVANPKEVLPDGKRIYLDYMKATLENSDQIHLLVMPYRGFTFSNKTYDFSTMLCYFDKEGNLIKELVNNIGVLLQQLRPLDAELSTMMMEWYRPIVIRGSTIPLAPDKRTKYTFSPYEMIEISLHTDIWFPKVIGYLDEVTKGLYDNSVLAACNTPRFNNFLKDLYQFVQKLGGTWEITDILERYKDMINATEILLE